MYAILSIFLAMLGALVYLMYNLSLEGATIPDWITNVIGGAIGSIVAILGSVLIQISSESRKLKQQKSIQMSLLQKEFYDNFIVCLFRIEQKSSSIEYFENIYDSLMGNGQVGSNKKFQEDLSDLYFFIKRGSHGTKCFVQFYKEAFEIQQKKPRHYNDVYDLVNSVGIDQVYEFSIIHRIIHLDYKYKLNLNLPFKDFQKILRYNPDIIRNIEEDTKYYIAEILSRKLFEGDKVIHFVSDVLVGEQT